MIYKFQNHLFGNQQMANIEVSLSSTNTPRRRKGTSLGGNASSPRPSLCDDITNVNSTVKQEQHSAISEREAIIQSLRLQLGLGKLPRPGLPLDDTEVSKSQQELQKLKIDADKKRFIIRNLKSALSSLDIQDK